MQALVKYVNKELYILVTKSVDTLDAFSMLKKNKMGKKVRRIKWEKSKKNKMGKSKKNKMGENKE